MTYASGGLIQATDYNNLINGANQLNTVWSTGTGNVGYGQTALGNVSTSSTVTATQWSTLLSTLNQTIAHQTGANVANVTLPTAGSTITYLSAVSTAVATAYTNALTANTNGTTVTGATFSPNFTVAATTAAQTWNFTRTITFASADQARYFFNAGGKFNFVTISATPTGSGRSTDWQTMIQTELANITNIAAKTNGGRSGTGGTVNTANTTLGYYGLTTTANVISKITATTAAYSGDYVQVSMRSNGTQGANGDKGSIVYLDFTVYSAARTYSNNINVTWNHRIDTIPPETTYLTNTWGTITIT